MLKVDGLKELLELKKQAASSGLKVSLIKDAGLTVVNPGTTTAIAIGPDKEELVDKITGKLKMV